jgi:hypothetical protein
LKNRSFTAQLFSGLLLSVVALFLTACGQVIYKEPAFNFANRPIPPSGLLQRVMVSYTSNGSSGGLQILDGLRDLRGNVQNTVPFFSIAGYSGGNPARIINYPEQSTGYVFSTTDGRLTAVNYGKETTGGDAATFSPATPSLAASTDGSRFVAAQEGSGQIAIVSTGGTFYLNLPNVYRVAMNRGNSVILAMVRNSDKLYRIVKLNATSTPVTPPGSIDCQPLLLPVYCIVPVPGPYDRPADVTFSLDGNSAYVLNCGPECGGTRAGITFLQQGALTVDTIPTVDPNAPSAPSPLVTGIGQNPLPIPGGVTVSVASGNTLYVAGQSFFNQNASGALVLTPRADGLLTGYLSTVNLTNNTVSNPYSISDGYHSILRFADDNTLWVAAQQCANGERKATGKNYNCLTRVALASGTPVPSIVPNVTPGGTPTVAYPNTDQNMFYYGSATGIAWVQNYHKVYTAYGGQIHAFNTADGSEINNINITVQGTVLDVAYMDAITNDAN